MEQDGRLDLPPNGFAAKSAAWPPLSMATKSGARTADFPHTRAQLVREHLRQRRRREQFFRADVFADPVWDMMLDLYAAHYEGQKVSVTSLCIAAVVPGTTALRWIKMMTELGWLIRARDASDGRRIYVELSDDARGRLDAYFDGIES